MSDDTGPGSLDDRHNRPALRLVESAGWKIVTSLITLILLPICAWGLNTVAGKLEKIDASIGAFTTQNAVNELRMQRTESDNAKQNDDIRTLQDRQAGLTYRIDNIERGRLIERSSGSRP